MVCLFVCFGGKVGSPRTDITYCTTCICDCHWLLLFQKLLHTALTVEEEKEKAAQKLEKKLQLAKLSYHQREQVWLEEMTEGILNNEGEKADDEGEVEERSVLSKRPIRADDRKTRKQIRKERERKEEVRS